MKTPSQPRAIYYIVAIQIWEYFSFYGMRAILILYLTHQLGYSDSNAITLFSAYASLVYITPILGGWIADRLLGNRVAVLLGAILMTLGHIVLGLESDAVWSLYLALGIIICGYGLFKSNISVLLGELYTPDDPRRDGGFSLLYAAGNIGSIVSPIACGLAAQWYGWHVGFALAGIGMFLGLLIFMTGRKHFAATRGINTIALKKKNAGIPAWGWLVVGVLLSPFFFTALLQYDLSGYLLALVCAGAVFIVARIMAREREQRKALWQVVLLMATGTLFWILAQQGGSSISLFIDHFVNRQAFGTEVPTALFQSVNAVAVMVAGVVLAWLSQLGTASSSKLVVWLKFSCGLALMAAGFMVLALNARLGEIHGQSSMWMMVAGLSLMGFAELFIDPVAMAQITRLNLPGVTGLLTGIYMLATGSVANYLAGLVAQQTTESQAGGHAIHAYYAFFAQMGKWTVVCVALILALSVWRWWVSRKQNALVLD
ncbi:oligopeptide:H+ symporter [Shimwellia blattae]|uniref:Amino acid/peptide transporter YjdL n=1 Tax=Shimwellia blattae (strain ATCC 29907 / DSM 4481 / JCM 1650 / NBRC 105725 / CDC 9005-74) TaxID=630626 RepID=I2BCI4_SHIBC|nr:oligopeptide:H+ symporter [Shimwellia blattae]AFJ48238.1 amino acid/peptide transporter YjdL [Shimwellia blattae DSM 4481 = NBRC 105725]GAB80933.1 putative dipeptide/tripeptide permease YjdL [Shimwellia blattae DSM 4481 = NBRC 105725]VDY65733.1 Probable dipeptide and tripeptide permease YjdL [Shimwellia blattae]VEC25556.1 Probable dipeptide and tripeptide permease YjdL [Shimwellia blattae]